MKRCPILLTAGPLLAALVGGAMGCSPPAPEADCADILLVGGNLVTVDSDRPRAEAMALRGDRILAVGSAGELERAHHCEGSTERIDLEGRTVIPGLIDAHAHLRNLGRALQRVDLVGTASLDEVLARIAERIADARPGEWILGRGWDQNDWPEERFPDRRGLDAISPDNPVVVDRVDGHAVLANGLALRAGGVDAETADPPGGEIVRDPSGRATGVLIDNATALVEREVPEPGPAEDRASLILAMEHCLALGLTGVHDTGIGYDGWDLYRQMADTGELTLRVYAMLGVGGSEGVPHLERDPEIGRAGGMLTVRALKVYADGALGSRGAALLEDYSDRAGHRGLLLTRPEDMEEIVRAGTARGYQIATHAIGDRGNREILDIYERLLLANAGADLRLRVEHAQTLSPRDIPRFGALGVIPSMQPTHATSDMYWVEERLGPERVRGAYAWRALLDAGARTLPLGSDFPVESANPFWGIHAAVTRQDAAGLPDGGWFPDQALTRDEALAGFTRDAAWAAFEEADKGSLSPGKYADFVILDRDLMIVPAAEIRGIRPRETWVGGHRAYVAESGP